MIVLNALRWNYQTDLNAPPGRWSCEFLESGSTRFLPGESLSKQGGVRVTVDVVIDGASERLVEGIAREWGSDEESDSVVGSAEGIDLKGVLLDFFPSTAVTYRGMELLSAGTAPTPTGARKRLRLGSDSLGNDVVAAFYETFQTVAADVCTRAGLRPAFDCRDYDLGAGIVWDTDVPANQILASLAEPFNATERFKLDMFLESDSIRFVERGKTAPPTVEIEYARILTRRVRRFVYPPFNDVQVRGATFRYLDPETTEEVVMGVPDEEEYALSYRFLDKEAGSTQNMGSPEVIELQDIVVAETNGTRYLSKAGELIRHAATKQYSFYVLRDPNNPDQTNFISLEPRARREDTEETWEYGGPHGEATRHVKTVFVEDSTVYKKIDGGVVTAFGPVNIAQYILREETRTEYDSAGDPLHQSSQTYTAEEPKPKSVGQPPAGPTGLVLDREVEQTWWWSKGKRGITTVTRQRDRSIPGRYIITSNTEYLTGKETPGESVYWKQTQDGIIGMWQAGHIASLPPAATQAPEATGGTRLSTDQVVAGPDSAQLRFTFQTLGNKDDCEYFRGKLIQERRSARHELTVEFVPNLNVREGLNLTVLNAPPRWERDTFFVTARKARHTPDEMRFEATGLAWIDP